MKPEKFDDFCKVIRLLDYLMCHFRLENENGFIHETMELASGRGYILSVGQQVTYLDFYDFTYLVNMDSNPNLFYPEIYDDVVAKFPIRWPYQGFQSGTRRVVNGRLDMKADMYPLLPATQSLEPDEIDSVIFQNLTKYTINEVNTQLYALALYPKRSEWTAKDIDDKGFFPTISIDYRVLDLLSPEDLLEIIELLYLILKEQSSVYTKLYTDRYGIP